MTKLSILSVIGDKVVEWDEQRLEAGDPDALATEREAKRLFAEQRAQGATAFVVNDRGLARRILHFDPYADQVIVISPRARS